MELKFSVHPLFFAFGLYFAFIGKIFVFIIYTLTDLLHELGHSIIANRQGYCLNKITLMPFGAVVSGESNGMNSRDELKIALAGPLLNIFIGLFFVALWWIFPSLYALTDLIASANFSLAVINFLPFFPLDGGRILLSVLSVKLKREKAVKICKGIGVFGGLLLLGLFILSILNEVNFSLLFFSAFIIFGALSRDKENKYIKIISVVSKRRLKNGVEIKKIAVDKDITIKKLISVIDTGYINEVVVYENENPIAVLSQKEVIGIIEKANIYGKLKENIKI